ncbi:hypothetical protein [Clostridium perfringens]|uniref:hypothetical protein n=1 Tax=Clostridium perfringens TaxID=1502 RepID=UPI0024BCE6D0|nr:hypothetical protein [Clostridium perfringens]
MTVDIIFKRAFIFCIISYFVYIAFRILFGKLNLKNYFKGDKVEITMRLIKRLTWVILNLICAALALVGLFFIEVLDLKFAANIISVVLVILIIKLSINLSNYLLRKFK